MKHFIIRLVVLALALQPLGDLAHGQLSSIQRGELPVDNLIKNPGAEVGAAYWTASGSSVLSTSTNTTSQVARGTRGFTWTPANAAETLTSDAVTVPKELYGSLCRVTAMQNAGAANYTMTVVDGAASVLASVTLSSVVTWTRREAIFTCPTSGTMAVKFTAPTASGALYIDSVFLGEARPIAGAFEGQSADPSGGVTAGRTYFNTTAKKLKLYDGTQWAAVGGGAGEKNYVETGTSTATGWTCVGDLQVSTTTTAADLPREYTTASGIKITADADTQSTADYCYYDFTLDDVDQSKKLKIQWAQKTTGTYTAGQLAAIITTQADRTTAIHTPITTDIAATDYVATTTFDASTTATLSLVVRATGDMTTNGGVVLSDVIVGPGVKPQGAVVSEWQSFTPTWAGGITMATNTGWYRRVGGSMEIRASFTVTLGGSGSALTMTVPGGLTIDSSRLPDYNFNIGAAGFAQYLDSGTTVKSINVITGSTTALVFVKSGEARDSIDGDEFAVNDEFAVSATIPIAEWSGGGTVNLAQNSPQCAYSTDTTTTAGNTQTDNGLYGYDCGGTAILSIDSVTSGNFTAKRVRFPTAVQRNEVVDLYLVDADGKPFHVGNGQYGYTRQQNCHYGAFVDAGPSGVTTDVYVYFGNCGAKPGNSAYAAAGNAWSGLSTYKWFVVKHTGEATIGFGDATTTSSGLVSTGTQSFAGNKSFTGTVTAGTSASSPPVHTLYGNLKVDATGVSSTNAGAVQIVGPDGNQKTEFKRFNTGGLTTAINVFTVPARSSGVVEVGSCDATTGSTIRYMATSYWSMSGDSANWNHVEQVDAANGAVGNSTATFQVTSAAAAMDAICVTVRGMYGNAVGVTWAL